MANPRTIRTNLANRLKTIQGLDVYERWPSQINTPCAIISLVLAEPEQTMGRGDLTKWLFDVDLLMPLSAGWENAQDRMDPLLATSSTGGVFGAIAGDRTLGGSGANTFVKNFRDYGRRVVDESLEYLGCTLAIETWST